MITLSPLFRLAAITLLFFAFAADSHGAPSSGPSDTTGIVGFPGRSGGSPSSTASQTVPTNPLKILYGHGNPSSSSSSTSPPSVDWYRTPPINVSNVQSDIRRLPPPSPDCTPPNEVTCNIRCAQNMPLTEAQDITHACTVSNAGEVTCTRAAPRSLPQEARPATCETRDGTRVEDFYVQTDVKIDPESDQANEVSLLTGGTYNLKDLVTFSCDTNLKIKPEGVTPSVVVKASYNPEKSEVNKLSFDFNSDTANTRFKAQYTGEIKGHEVTGAASFTDQGCNATFDCQKGNCDANFSIEVDEKERISGSFRIQIRR